MTLFKAGKITRPEVGIALGRSASGSNVGQLAFGGIVPSKYSNGMTVMENMSQEGYWEVPLTVHSNSSAPLKDRTGVIDTRSSVMWAPQADVIALFTGVKGACKRPWFLLFWCFGLSRSIVLQVLSDSSGLVLPCSSRLNLTFALGDHSTKLEASDVIFMPLQSSTLCGESECCLSTIQPAPASVGLGDGQWILGIPALRKTYIGFNYQNNTIGLAHLK